MLTYTLRQLEYFTAAADCGSVAGAAATLNVSQPSVSNAILKLEDHFGVQLFVRHHAQGVSLTPVGHRILADARSLLRHANDLQHNAKAAGDVIQGGLELGCFITLAPSFMPALVTGFTEHYPGVSINLQEGIQNDLVTGLGSGRFELAFLYDLDLPDTVARVPLCTFEPYVLLPEAHALTEKSALSLGGPGGRAADPARHPAEPRLLHRPLSQGRHRAARRLRLALARNGARTGRPRPRLLAAGHPPL